MGYFWGGVAVGGDARISFAAGGLYRPFFGDGGLRLHGGQAGIFGHVLE